MESTLDEELTLAAYEPQCPPLTRAIDPFQDVQPPTPDSNPLFVTRFVPAIVASLVPEQSAIAACALSSRASSVLLQEAERTAMMPMVMPRMCVSFGRGEFATHVPVARPWDARDPARAARRR